jgi:hypothetical protein
MAKRKRTNEQTHKTKYYKGTLSAIKNGLLRYMASLVGAN